MVCLLLLYDVEKIGDRTRLTKLTVQTFAPIQNDHRGNRNSTHIDSHQTTLAMASLTSPISAHPQLVADLSSHGGGFVQTRHGDYQ